MESTTAQNVKSLPKVRLLRKMMNKWIPVTDFIPNKGVQVLTFPNFGYQIRAPYKNGFAVRSSRYTNEKNKVTHWQPLPTKPPK